MTISDAISWIKLYYPHVLSLIIIIQPSNALHTYTWQKWPNQIEVFDNLHIYNYMITVRLIMSRPWHWEPTINMAALLSLHVSDTISWIKLYYQHILSLIIIIPPSNAYAQTHDKNEPIKLKHLIIFTYIII